MFYGVVQHCEALWGVVGVLFVVYGSVVVTWGVALRCVASCWTFVLRCCWMCIVLCCVYIERCIVCFVGHFVGRYGEVQGIMAHVVALHEPMARTVCHHKAPRHDFIGSDAPQPHP